jgi:hypothetical protein
MISNFRRMTDMRKPLLAGVTLGVVMAISPLARANVTIDFGDYPYQSLSSLDGVTFSLAGGQNSNGSPVVNVFGNPNGLSNSSTGEYRTAERLDFKFGAPASGISFEFDNEGSSPYGRGASFFDAYDGANLVASGFLGFTNYGFVSVPGSDITLLEFDNGTSGRNSWLFGVDSLTFTPGAVPEPASVVLMAVGIAGLGLIRRPRSSGRA